jgi:hypothetical protein
MILLGSILLSTNIAPVSAATRNNNVENKNAIESVYAEEASEELLDYLSTVGIEVAEDSIIETVPLQNTENATEKVYGISVVSHQNDTINRTTVMLINKATGVPVSTGINATRGAFTASHSDNYVTISFTASYTTRFNSSYTDYAYRPLSVSFEYYLEGSTSSSNISRVGVNYICNGEVYSYPGFVDQGYCTSYSIPRTVYSPTPGVTYSNNSPYS